MAVPTREEPADETIQIDIAQPNVKRLLGQIQSSQGVVPFVGAGLSIPFGLPGWRQFLMNLADENGEQDAVSELLSHGRYEEAAELLLDAMASRAFNDALVDAFGEDAIVDSDGVTAMSLLPRVSRGPVVTTNFDRVLEREFARAARPFERVILGTTQASVAQALQLDSPFLMKVHGDIEEPSSRILTRLDYDAQYGDLLAGEEGRTQHSRLLQRLVEGRSMLFLGCSLQEDRMVKILELAAARPGAVADYTLLPEPASVDELRVRKRFLSEREIRPIWYPAGRHDLIPSFLEYLLAQSDYTAVEQLESLVSPEDFFRPLLQPGPSRLLHHDWELVGRTDVLERLHDWVDGDASLIAILSGRGGIGKSKVLHAFSNAFAKRHPKASLRFALANVPFSPERLSLTSGMNVIVVDDAHHREDLGILLQFARKYSDRVKLLLMGRPYRVDSLRSQLSEARFDIREAVDLGELHQLAPKEIQELARQALGGDLEQFAERLAEVTRDSPLVTVVGGQLLRERFVNPELLERDEEFRSVLLDRFQDELEGNVGGYIDRRLLRDGLALIAAIGPIRANDSRLLSHAAEFIGFTQNEFIEAIDALEAAGVLARRGQLLRITPDVLADHALHRACFRPDGTLSEYAQRVFDAFRLNIPGQVLANLSELDWRIRSSSGESTTLLDGIWFSLETEFAQSSELKRCGLLGMLKDVALHQPDRVLQLVEFVMRNPAPPAEDQEFQYPWDALANEQEALPPLLDRIAHNLDYLPRVLDDLWELGRDDDRPLNQHPDHAMRILADLATVEHEKPLAFNEVVLDAVARWLESDDAHSHRHSLLDVLDAMLEKTGGSYGAEGPVVVIQPFIVNPSATAGIRNRALELIVGCLDSADLKVTLRAIQSLFKALEPPRPLYGMKITAEQSAEWLPERLRIFETIENLLAGSTELLVQLRAAKGLGRFAAHASCGDEIDAKAKSAIDAMPKSRDFELLAVLAGEYDAWSPAVGPESDDGYEARVQRNEEVVRTFVESFVASKPETPSAPQVLEDGLQRLALAGIESSPWRLWEELADQDIEIIVSAARFAIENPDSSLAQHLNAFLWQIRRHDRDQAIAIAMDALENGHRSTALAVSSWGRICADDIQEEDSVILVRLISHPDVSVRKGAADALNRLSRFQPNFGADLALKIDITTDPEMADAICEALCMVHRIDPTVLEDDDLRNVVSALRNLPRINGYHIARFLQIAAARAPRHVVAMLLGRISDGSVKPILDFDALPSHGLQDVFIGVNVNPEFGAMLRDIRTATQQDSWHSHNSVPELFAAASGRYSPEGLQIIEEWACSDNPEEVRAAARLFRHSPPSFIFDQSELVSRVLENAYRFGSDTYREVEEHLRASVMNKPRQRTLGLDDVFPEDVDAAQRATEILGTLTPGYPAHRFYSNLKASAEENMHWERIRNEEQFG